MIHASCWFKSPPPSSPSSYRGALVFLLVFSTMESREAMVGAYGIRRFGGSGGEGVLSVVICWPSCGKTGEMADVSATDTKATYRWRVPLLRCPVTSHPVFLDSSH